MDSPIWVWLLGVFKVSNLYVLGMFLVCFLVSNMRMFRVSEKIVLLPCVKRVFRVLLPFFPLSERRDLAPRCAVTEGLSKAVCVCVCVCVRASCMSHHFS
jgi:hypothetical protein